MLCVNRLNELAPGLPDGHSIAFFALKESLDRDPFLAYVEETEKLYRVRNTDGTLLSIPKRRSVETSDSIKPSIATAVTRLWLMLAMVGLLLAGIGTLIFAPLAALTALTQSGRTRSTQLEIMVVLVIAAILFLIGLIFSTLLYVHMSG